jgi:hypothetical protein
MAKSFFGILQLIVWLAGCNVFEANGSGGYSAFEVKPGTSVDGGDSDAKRAAAVDGARADVQISRDSATGGTETVEKGGEEDSGGSKGAAGTTGGSGGTTVSGTGGRGSAGKSGGGGVGRGGASGSSSVSGGSSGGGAGGSSGVSGSAAEAGSGGNPPPSCTETGSLYWSTNDHCYYPTTKLTSWNVARDNCTNAGAYLATITSGAEQSFVAALAGSSSLWIGFSKIGTANFSWISEEPRSYTNWASGEPNNTGEVAATMEKITGKWADYPVSASYASICERLYKGASTR